MRLLLTTAKKEVNVCFGFSELSINQNKNRQKLSQKAKIIGKLLNLQKKLFTPITLISKKYTRPRGIVRGGKIQNKKKNVAGEK